jgi:hypothetical protein
MRRTPVPIEKDPQSDEPQGFDWTAYLAKLGSSITIQTSTWTVTGPDAALTTHDPSIITGNLKTQVYMAGGTAKKTYLLTNRIVTNSAPPVTDERSFSVLVLDK